MVGPYKRYAFRMSGHPWVGEHRGEQRFDPNSSGRRGLLTLRQSQALSPVVLEIRNDDRAGLRGDHAGTRCSMPDGRRTNGSSGAPVVDGGRSYGGPPTNHWPSAWHSASYAEPLLHDAIALDRSFCFTQIYDDCPILDGSSRMLRSLLPGFPGANSTYQHRDRPTGAENRGYAGSVQAIFWNARAFNDAARSSQSRM